MAYLKAGQLQKARVEAHHALTVRDTADGHSLLGEIEGAAHSRKASATQYQIAAQMDPSEDRIFNFGESSLHFYSDAAIAIFSYGVQKYPASTRLRVGLGIAYYVYGRFDDAAEALCQAVDMDATDPQPIDFLGKLKTLSLPAFRQVNQRLSAFLKIHPEHAAANYYLARNLLNPPGTQPSKEDLVTVERLLKTAIRLDPKLSEAYFELGRLFESTNHLGEAAAAYEHAVKLDLDFASFHYRLAFTYRATGRKREAARELQIFKQLRARQEAREIQIDSEMKSDGPRTASPSN